MKGSRRSIRINANKLDEIRSIRRQKASVADGILSDGLFPLHFAPPPLFSGGRTAFSE